MIRRALPADLDRLVEVEQLSWPAGLAADRAQLESRLATFPEGQWVAEFDGALVGYVAAQRLAPAFFEAAQHRFDTLTDGGTIRRSHDPQGEIYHLIGVGVAPQAQGTGLARQLVNQQLDTARRLPGVRRILGVTRPVRYHRHDQMSIEEYVHVRRSDDRYLDPMLAFHLGAGARLVSILPHYRPADTASRGYGVLIEYPVIA